MHNRESCLTWGSSMSKTETTLTKRDTAAELTDFYRNNVTYEATQKHALQFARLVTNAGNKIKTSVCSPLSNCKINRSSMTLQTARPLGNIHTQGEKTKLTLSMHLSFPSCKQCTPPYQEGICYVNQLFYKSLESSGNEVLWEILLITLHTSLQNSNDSQFCLCKILVGLLKPSPRSHLNHWSYVCTQHKMSWLKQREHFVFLI